MKILTLEESTRLETLSKDWLSAAAILDIVGVDPNDELVLAATRSFATLTKRQHENDHGLFSRHTLELWLQHSRHLSFKEAALRVGMKETSLELLLDALYISKRIPEKRVGLPTSIISEDVIRMLNRSFSSLQSRIFGSHSDFCARLHEAAKIELSITIEPVNCTVSTRLSETPDYAYYRCAVSHEPVGLRYALAMDSKKPIRLLPDHVSKFTLYRGFDLLAPKLLGAPPRREDLDTLFNNAQE